jgi:tetratricopeptide (TPR) repeat protein
VALCTTLSGVTFQRASLWATTVSLMGDAAEKNPGSVRVVGNFAHSLASAGRRGEARVEFARAMRNRGRPSQLAAVARNWAGMEFEAGDPAAALTITDLGIARDPRSYELHAIRTQVLLALFRNREALDAAWVAMQLDSSQPMTPTVFGIALRANGRASEALTQFEAALRVDPTYGAALTYRFLVLADLGRRAEACGAWRTALAAGGTTLEAQAKAAALGCGGR